MDNIYREQYLKHHSNFIEQLKIIFSSEETIKVLNTISQTSDESKLTRGQLFSSSISGDNLDMFVKNKIKVFSHKSPNTQTISESLFGPEFCIKNLLNNQPEEVKKVIWTDLHTLCMIGELLKPESVVDESKVKLLNQTIYKARGLLQEPEHIPEEPSDSSKKYGTGVKHKLEDMIGVKVNDETKTMIDDIVQSFEKVLTGQSSGNPLSGIMEISQNISVKYADKINKGEIELDKLMESISKYIPGMDQMMSGMMDGIGKKAAPKEKIIIDENFSTANVQVGLNKEKETKSFDIGGILKMADKFGVIPGGKQCDENGENIPGIGKIMELMQKLDKAETKEDAEALKQEMDSFLQKELGVDVTSLNAQLDQVTQQMKEAQEKNDN